MSAEPRTARGTLIYVAHYDPATDFNGAKMRLLALARICTRMGYDLVYVRSSDKAVFTLDGAGWFQYRGLFEENRFFRADDVICVIFSWFWISQYSDGVTAHLRLANPRVPVVLDTIDAVGTRQNREYLTTDMQTPTASFSLLSEQNEVRRADWIIAITEEERHYFRRMTDRPISVISYSEDEAPLPRYVRRDYGTLAKQDRFVSGFFGSRNYANYHSAVRSCHVAWMSGQVDRFVLAGSVCNYEDLSLRLKARYGDWLDVLGMVDDPAEFYAGIDFTTNILAFGSGIKIKIIESLSYGIPTLCNDIALEGLRYLLPMNLGLFRAETAFEYTEQLRAGLVTPDMERFGVNLAATLQRDLFVSQIRDFVSRITPARA